MVDPNDLQLLLREKNDEMTQRMAQQESRILELEARLEVQRGGPVSLPRPDGS